MVGSNEIAPEDHVDYKKARKLKQLAEIWLQKHKYPVDFPYQIDVAAVTVDSVLGKPQLEYFWNAIEGQ